MKLHIGNGAPVELKCRSGGVNFVRRSINRSEDVRFVMAKVNRSGSSV